MRFIEAVYHTRSLAEGMAAGPPMERQAMKTPSNSTNAVGGTTSAKRHDLNEKVYIGELSDIARRIATHEVVARFCDEALPKLIELARVPKARRNGFWWAVGDALLDCLLTRGDIHANSELQKNESFARAVEALKSARKALAQMDESAREAFRERILVVQEGIDEFLTALEEPKTEPKRPLHSDPLRQRGRPAGTVQNSASQDFVHKLLECASLNGGTFTQKNIRRGTLIEALELLAPYLPKGVDPEKLHPSTLQRIMDAHRKRYGKSRRHRTRN
jgi:hypothetical protein